MATDSKLVLLGAGVVSIGAYVTAGGAGTLVDVGHTQGSPMLSINAESVQIESERSVFSVASSITKMGASLKWTCLEVGVDNLRIALAQASGNISGTGYNKTLLVGNITEALQQIQIVTKGPGTTGVRTLTFWKCLLKSAGEIPYGKGVAQNLPLEFEVLLDESVTTADKLFKQVDA